MVIYKGRKLRKNVDRAERHWISLLEIYPLFRMALSRRASPVFSFGWQAFP
jgi:hypothetical protein